MNKLNKKGFTLVELLAVIVILSVLLLIALPSGINIMNKARNDAFKDEAMSFISAAETQYASEGGEGCKYYYFGDVDGKPTTASPDSSKVELTTMKKKAGYQAWIMVSEDSASIDILDKNNGKELKNKTKDALSKPDTTVSKITVTSSTNLSKTVTCPSTTS